MYIYRGGGSRIYRKNLHATFTYINTYVHTYTHDKFQTFLSGGSHVPG